MALLCTGMTMALTVVSLLGCSLAVPLAEKLNSLSPSARDILRRSTPAAPHFVVYDDAWVSPLPTAAELKGYTVYALSFWLTSGPADMAVAWQDLSESQRSSCLKEYNGAGISLIVSAFGETDTPTTLGADSTTVADHLGTWVRKYDLQGVDIDYEDFGAFEAAKPAAAEPWLITLTKRLRTHLPQGEYILTHAPVAPWFAPNVWNNGGYLAIHKSVGHLIDWYNIQFYNQGSTEYTTCDGLINKSSSQWPQTALLQIATNGIDRNKLVIGKPAKPSDASNGYIAPSELAKCVAEAHSKGWNGGVMVWEYPDAPSNWVTTVRGKTF